MNKNSRYKPNEQDPKIRKSNFLEVSNGFDKEKMLLEADRCLNCKNAPCKKGCPVEIDIPKFIGYLKEDNLDKALETIKSYSSLPAVCGRVCPQEIQCEQLCVRNKSGGAVAIGLLERYVGDYGLTVDTPPITVEKLPFKVAVVGSGPASLSCAGELIKNGIDVTVFEAFHKPGGVLVYGIPEFRLPKKLVNDEIEKLVKAGVKLELNTVIGKTVLTEELIEEYDAVFIGTGAGLPIFMNIKGEELNGVYSANEYLTRINLMGAYKENTDTPIKRGDKVVVVGAGNVAMDAARTAVRMGASEVNIVYRRTEEDMPARKEEIHHAKEEGIIIQTLTSPTEILGEGKVSGIKCIRTKTGEKDDKGRNTIEEIAGTEFTIECDLVIMSIGTSPNPLIKNTTKGLKTDPRGTIIVNEENNMTSLDMVYAGGDTVTGAATVILAMGAGKKAGQNIYRQLVNKLNK